MYSSPTFHYFNTGLTLLYDIFESFVFGGEGGVKQIHFL